ncbi:uncharacterized protein IWZ02DRAFT_430544 [Phyllosticta citriasiana]|uniref:uncharacterized protein n=1 Tax=Phyllosticta citriasiana TaxID=595635 RepID=UPI0030FD596B
MQVLPSLATLLLCHTVGQTRPDMDVNDRRVTQTESFQSRVPASAPSSHNKTEFKMNGGSRLTLFRRIGLGSLGLGAFYSWGAYKERKGYQKYLKELGPPHHSDKYANMDRDSINSFKMFQEAWKDVEDASLRLEDLNEGEKKEVIEIVQIQQRMELVVSRQEALTKLTTADLLMLESQIRGEGDTKQKRLAEIHVLHHEGVAYLLLSDLQIFLQEHSQGIIGELDPQVITEWLTEVDQVRLRLFFGFKTLPELFKDPSQPRGMYNHEPLFRLGFTGREEDLKWASFMERGYRVSSSPAQRPQANETERE